MHVRLLALGIVLAWTGARAEIISQWRFNGTVGPSTGNGTSALLGGVTGTFAQGSPNDTDSNNTGLNTGSYPSQGTSNKTAGVEFRVSTVGYSDITVGWEQRLSATASKHLRVQYSANGETFQDLAGGVVASERTLSFDAKGCALGGIPGVADNSAFAFRLVSEFESTALGAGRDEYVTTYATNSYSRSGTVRFDMVTVSGTPIPGANTPPQISIIGDQNLRVREVSAPINFTVSDREDLPDALKVTQSCSDTSVVAGVSVSGSGKERVLTLAAGETSGNAKVTLTVEDSAGRTGSTSFTVIVLPSNTAPALSGIQGTNIVTGGATDDIGFVVGDLETVADALTLSAVSGNPSLVPPGGDHILFGGTGSNRTVKVIPAPRESGVAPIFVTVSDGEIETSSAFAVMVRPSADVALYEPFSYADGSVCSNSGWLWANRSGTNGDCQVRGGELELAGGSTEDVVASLAGGPYARSNGMALYASFQMRFLSSPKSTPEYFAHFVGGNSLRARVYAGAADVWPGAFRLYVANGSETNTVVPWNLSTNTSYTVVTRYEIDTAKTTLWLNPTSESNAGTSANDPQSPVAISGYGFRQDSGLGTTVKVDDLRVGLTFASVVGEIQGVAPRLGIEWRAGRVVLTWDQTGWVLQSAPSVGGPFLDQPEAVSPLTNDVRGSAQFFRLRRSFPGKRLKRRKNGLC